MRVLNPDNLPLGNEPRTITFWLKAESIDPEAAGLVVYGRTASTLAEEPSTHTKGYFSLIWRGDLAVTQVGFAAIGSVVPINEWVHVAMTFDGVTHRVVENGVETSANAMATNTEAGPLTIGSLVHFFPTGCGQFGSCPFSGQIDEVQIFNRALSQTEIQSIFNSAAAGVCNPHLQEKILYSTNKTGDNDIWMMNPDGSNHEPLVVGPNNQIPSQVSPDGKLLGYLEFRGGIFHLMILDLETRVSRDVVADVRWFEWMPDGQSWIVMHPNGPSSNIVELDLQGQNLRNIAVGPRAQFLLGVSGDHVYFGDGAGTFDPIRVFNLSTGATDIVVQGDGRGIRAGDVSANGRFVGYSKYFSGLNEPFSINIYEVDTNTNSQITPSNKNSFRPSFSPEGTEIVYVETVAAGQNQLLRTSLSGNTEQVLLNDGWLNDTPKWVRIVLDPQEDTDGDSVSDNSDNCPMIANPDQLDVNNNGIGDICEPPTTACTSTTASTDAGVCSNADATVDAGSIDPLGTVLEFTQEPAGPYPLGDTSVLLTATTG